MRASLSARSSPTGAALTEGVLALALTLPYTISYLIVVDQVDPLVCQGIPMSFGSFAKWSYIICFLVNVALIPTGYSVAKQIEAGEESALDQPYKIIKILRAIYMVIVWIYACVALANRDTCGSRGLVDLIWVTVILPVVLVCLICCCVWCFVIVAGTAVVAADQNSRLNNAGVDTTENLELRELRRALREREKEVNNSQQQGQPLNL